MKKRELKLRNNIGFCWSKQEAEAARKARASFRAWMDRHRLKNVANELAKLEKQFLYRADLMTDMVRPGMPDPNNARWLALMRREQDLARRVGNLREQIGLVLEP